MDLTEQFKATKLTAKQQAMMTILADGEAHSGQELMDAIDASHTTVLATYMNRLRYKLRRMQGLYSMNEFVIITYVDSHKCSGRDVKYRLVRQCPATLDELVQSVLSD